MSVSLSALACGSLVASVGFCCPFMLLGWTSRGASRRSMTGVPQLGELMSRIPILRPLSDRRARLERNARCLAQMPILLDIVTLGLSAGLSFDASLDLYRSRVRGELSNAIGLAMLEWRTGVSSRAEALTRLADEFDSQAFRRFSDAVLEALAFGSPLAATLARQAQAIRDDQSAQVEEQIEKVPVKMLIPLGTLIVPAMLLAILGPLLGSAIGVV